MFTVKENGGSQTQVKGMQFAIAMAESIVHEKEQSTITVEDKSGQVLASVSNSRIIGQFTKQQWGGHKGDEAIFVGTEEFDATDAILLMDHSDLKCLEDHDETTDIIGSSHVSWDGPYEVDIVDSICKYFGVPELGDISENHLFFVRNRVNPQPPTDQTVTLTIKVKLRTTPGVSVTSFIENMEYSVISNTPGIIVRDTEIVDGE